MESSKAVTMAENFIYNYGRKSFKDLLGAFTRGTSNTIVADNLGVTRQRVHQWKKAFTKKSTIVRPEIAQLL